MRLAPLLILKCIENPESRSAQPHRVPRDRSLFFFRQRLRRFQKLRYLSLFSRLRFHLRPNRKFRHGPEPPADKMHFVTAWFRFTSLAPLNSATAAAPTIP